MKKLLLTTALIACYLTSLFSQPCLPEGIIFNTQVQIDSFQINYPNCTEIEGDIEISGSSIMNLNGLNVLTSIEGGLQVFGNPSLTSLSGLENITFIGGDLSIGHQGGVGNHVLPANLSLTSLTGLNNLAYLGGELIIHGNFTLISLTGLEGLTAIGGSLDIASNDFLTSLEGLDNLTTIGGDFIIGGEGDYYGNSSLVNLTGLENLTFIEGNFRITHNETLTTLVNLESLTSIGGSLTISGNNLQNLLGLEGLTIINEYLLIQGTGSLNDLNGLNNITTIVGTFGFFMNMSLNDFQGLSSLSTIGGDFLIGYNGDPIPIGNPSLNNFSGLENLSSIGGNLYIVDSEELINLSGLENLTSLGGNLHIGSGFTNSMGNPLLSSIEGISNISPGSIESLTIRKNISLSNCHVQSICDYLSSPIGTITIHNNAPGCYSQQEVEEACDASAVPEAFKSDFSIYPNPATKDVIISTNNDVIITEVNIYNQVGQIIIHKSFLPNKIDVSMLQEGMYIIELVTNDIKVKKKLIIR